jgi:hypothetical protein
MARLLLAAALLAGLATCSAVREQGSVVTPKLLKLQEEQAKLDAQWKPVRPRAANRSCLGRRPPAASAPAAPRPCCCSGLRPRP